MMSGLNWLKTDRVKDPICLNARFFEESGGTVLIIEPYIFVWMPENLHHPGMINVTDWFAGRESKG